LAKNWLTVHNISFYLAIGLWFRARHYKLGDRINNELFIYKFSNSSGLTVLNTSSSPSLVRWQKA